MFLQRKAFRSPHPDGNPTHISEMDLRNPERHLYSRYTQDSSTRAEHILSKIMVCVSLREKKNFFLISEGGFFFCVERVCDNLYCRLYRLLRRKLFSKKNSLPSCKLMFILFFEKRHCCIINPNESLHAKSTLGVKPESRYTER